MIKGENMEQIQKIAFAKLTAQITGGEFISTPRQLENGTFMFTFPSKPGKKYGIYSSGIVRCITEGRYGDSMTPILWNPVVKHTRHVCGRDYTYEEKTIRKVSFDEGLFYLQKRFYQN